MSTYRFLEDAYINGVYYQAGTTNATADAGGSLPTNWIPNGNVDPLDTAAYNAMLAAGPQPLGLVRTQFSNLPVQPPITRWVQDPLSGYTLVAGRPPYFAQGLYFDGNTVLASSQELVTFNDAKISFAGWFKSTWASVSSVWVVDPTVNNDPYLEVVTRGIFVIYVADKGVWVSTDAVHWSEASTPIDRLPGLGQYNVPLSSPIYLNGLWVFSYSFDTGGGPFNAIIYSWDALNWNLGFQGNASNLYMSVLVPGHGSNPSGSNQIQLTNSGFVPPSQVQTIPIPCKNPANAPPNIQNGDNDLLHFGDVLVDPAQGGGTLDFTGTDGFYAQNPLPSGITAVRFTEPGGSTEMVEYTSTPITQLVVNSQFLLASWTTSLSLPTSVGGGSYFYCLQSFASTTGGLRFSQGNSNNTLYVDSIRPIASAWQHIMGTIDGSATLAACLIDGSSTGQVGQTGTVPFSVAPTNGKILYVGGTPGNLFVGDICDLSIWFDKVIDNLGATYNQLVDANGHPIDPRIYFSTTSLGIPDAFISGPVSTALNRPIGGVLTFFVQAGVLQDSNSSPSQLQPI